MAKVCVLFPVHNAAPHLGAALASLLAQTMQDIEILALDDGSTDGSSRLLDVAAAGDRRLRVIHRPNRGLIATLNAGLALTDAPFIARMDADDFAYPERLRRQIDWLEGYPDHALLGTNFDSLFPGERLLPAEAPVLTRPGERAILGRFCTALRHPTVIFARDRLPDGVLHYDLAYPCAEDFDLFRRIADLAPIAEVPEPLLAYRMHPGSVSVRQADQMVATHLKILRENLDRHYPFASFGLEGLPTRLTPEGAERAGTMIRLLDDHRTRQPEPERQAYAQGVTTTFYFLFTLFCRAGHFDLAERFIRAARRAGSVRRRERVLLGIPGTLAKVQGIGFQWSEQAAHRQALRRARPAAAVLPGYAQAQRRAAAWQDAAQQEMRGVA